MNTNTPIFSCALTLGLLLGLVPVDRSAPTPAAAVAPVMHAASQPAGPELNGTTLNGVQLQGVHLQGVTLQGSVALDSGILTPVGGKLDGVSFGNLKVHRSGFVASVEVGDEMVELSGADLIGAQLLFKGTTITDAGEVVATKVLAALIDVEPLDGSTLAHHMVVYDAENGGWHDPCPDNGGLGLIPLQGAWDPETGDALGGSQVTLACRGDVLAKCVEWGYEPWRSNEVADLHQACTRMARADYCGDGTPMTVDGTKIDVYDSLGIQEQATDWRVEAEWGPDGATCVGGNALRLSLLGLDKPECLADLYDPECGELVGEAQLANGYAG